MRTIQNTQNHLPFQLSGLSLTKAYAERYEAISEILDQAPQLLELAHQDMEKSLEDENGKGGRLGGFTYTSEMVFRLALCQVLEGASLRSIVVRVDDSLILRHFTRIHNGPMMGHGTLCKLRGAISAETWVAINQALATAAITNGSVTGEKLRLDTTAVETNIHYPTDSSLLWDSYRTLERLIGKVREQYPQFVGARRCHVKVAKRLSVKIARLGVAKTESKKQKRKELYTKLIGAVKKVCILSGEVACCLETELKTSSSSTDSEWMEARLGELRNYTGLAKQVIWQASERILHERPVQNSKKLFSIFEEHTELLVRV